MRRRISTRINASLQAFSAKRRICNVWLCNPMFIVSYKLKFISISVRKNSIILVGVFFIFLQNFYEISKILMTT